MINKIIGCFLVIGILYSFLTNQMDTLYTSLMNSSMSAVKVFLGFLPVLCFWNGFIQLMVDGGLMNRIERFVYPLFKRLFKGIPEGHPVIGLITSSLLLNALGAGNAATALSLKTMEELQKLNDNKEIASRSMITYVVLSTTGLTIVPTTVLGLLIAMNSKEPTAVLFPIFVSSFISTLMGLLLHFLFEVKKRV